MTGLGRWLASPAGRRRTWGAGCAPWGLLAEAAAETHGRVPLRLDRPLRIAPGLGVDTDYASFSELVVETSGSLHEAGLARGDVLAIVKAHNIDVIALAQAAARLGAVPALLAPDFEPGTIRVLLHRLGNPMTIADDAAIIRHSLASPGLTRRLISVDGSDAGGTTLDQYRGHRVPPAAPRADHELVAITHTSGTTGVPKLISHSGASLAGQSLVQVLGGRVLLGRRDVIATCLTTAHARTLSGLATIAALGLPHLAMVDPDPASAAPLMARHRPTLIETFPNVFTRWEALAEDPAAPLANVRIFLSTFDAAHPRTIHRMLASSRRRLPVYAQAYAQSETGAIALSFRLSRRHAGDARHVGWPALAFNRVRLVDPTTGSVLRRPGRSGAIEMRGPGLFAGYLGEPERTAQGWHDGWWRTGDLGSRRIDGAVRLQGRAVDAVDAIPDYLAWEDIVLARLEELEELVILADPAGRPAVVVTTRGDQPLDPARWAAATSDIPGLGTPLVLSWNQLPTTATWKVRRPALRDQLFPHDRAMRDGG
ncbi:AMP-binding protein [Streptomyces sp. NPDC006385]|uniref:class I adenylate-forming enzyme family protein n=1 Tax=Streptomyces sp. NPDC006385 TaxID=3156761 RepID=UPI00339F0387